MATIKAGKYRFNDVLTQFSTESCYSQDLEFEFYLTDIDNYENPTATITYKCLGQAIYQEVLYDGRVGAFQYVFTREGADEVREVYLWDATNGWRTSFITVDLSDEEKEEIEATYPGILPLLDRCYGNGIKTMTITEDQEVTEEFYAWFNENTVLYVATAESVKTKIQSLIDKANETTGNADADITSAINRLCDGYCVAKDEEGFRGIYIDAFPKTEYKVGERLNTEGGILCKYYDDREYSLRMDFYNSDVFGFPGDETAGVLTSAHIGKHILTVKYLENGVWYETTYQITVTE